MTDETLFSFNVKATNHNYFTCVLHMLFDKKIAVRVYADLLETLFHSRLNS